jgi:hypothetical protein
LEGRRHLEVVYVEVQPRQDDANVGI